ncbi:MAG: hypothetical protein KZQ83_06570 [gamma proteobacterium symbiont of Taylorina sp.]|nr:hypothetical protein [gamma proteobacterium symbiont of Taylorina sp.]
MQLYKLVIIAMLLMPLNSYAQDVSFIPRTWLGISDYQFIQAPRKGALADGSDFPEVKFEATFLMAGIGLTSIYDRYYIDFSYQDSSNEKDSFSSADFYEEFNGERKDFSAALGMKVLDNQANVYIGYKKGKTSGKGDLGTDLSFKESGFFIGASYGWIIADTGFLAINAAYADLDGHLKEVPGSVYPPGLNMDADSNTAGLSYGLSWTGIISKQWGYSIALDVNDYKFDDLTDNSSNIPLPDNIEEILYTAKISISHRF